MLYFKVLKAHNEWPYQKDFYLHGTIQGKYDTDMVTMDDSIYKERVSGFYYRGLPVGASFIDIPEGIHLCDLDGTVCMLFTWKRINITSPNSNCWTCSIEGTSPYDISLRQIGLIVDARDKIGLKDAENKFKKRVKFV